MSEESKAYYDMLDSSELSRYMEMRTKWPEEGDVLLVEGHEWVRHDRDTSGEQVNVPQARVTTWARNPMRKLWLVVDLFDITFMSRDEETDTVTYRLREYGELE